MDVQWLGRRPYEGMESAMVDFTLARQPETPDQLWMVEHEPVFTQGIAGRAQHVLNPGGIPVVTTQRGGQVTYHGLGQVVAYPLVDLRRLGIYVKEYVFRLETAVIQTLAHWGVTGHRVRSAPGIYVRLADPFSHAPLPAGEQGDPSADLFAGLGKISALGVKVTQHRTYHGLALNVAMDLSPFERIDPCGYVGLKTVDLKSCGVNAAWEEVAQHLAGRLTVMLSP